MRVDFHLHTTHSDGRSTATELSELIRANKVEHWTITDHDTTAAYDYLSPADQPPFAGVEISTTSPIAGEVHITALGIDRHNTELQTFLCAIRAIRRQRMLELCDMLQANGTNLTITDVQNEMALGNEEPSCLFTRSHLASALRRHGHTNAAETLFDQDHHLSSAGTFPDIATAIATIHAAGGVALLAHPGCYQNHQTVKKLLESAPFDGLESNHPRLLPRDRQFFRHLAEKMRLLESCGSDFHGRPDAQRPPGRCRLEKRRLEPLLKRLNRSQAG